MVSQQSVEEQLQRLEFNHHAWGGTEAKELPNVLLPDEEIYELVNGIYEGGFALLVATNIRVLLIDKKPLNYLTVEDVRFDMITEIDYSHRLLGAQINIASGSKTLRFRSYNQIRLRRLISHVQRCMAESKQRQSEHQEGQQLHLGQINQQLQTYLLAQHRQQEELRRQLEAVQTANVATAAPAAQPNDRLYDDIYADGVQEVFGKYQASQQPAAPQAQAAPAPVSSGPVPTLPASSMPAAPAAASPNAALHIAYSRLPMALRNRRFGRPSFHAHSQAPNPAPATQ